MFTKTNKKLTGCIRCFFCSTPNRSGEDDEQGNETIPYNAFSENGFISIARFNGSSWEFLGEQRFKETAQDLYRCLAVKDQIPYYIAFTENGALSVMKFKDNKWRYVGKPQFHKGNNIALNIDSRGSLYIAFSNNLNGDRLSVMGLVE